MFARPVPRGVAVLLGGAALAVVALAGVGRVSPVAGDWLLRAGILAAALVCAMRAVLEPQRRASWVLVTLALVLWLLGLRMAFYPLCAASMIMSIPGKLPALRRTVAIDVTIGFLGAAALAAAWIEPVIVDATFESHATARTALAYAVGDMVLLLLVAVSVPLGGRRLRRGFLLVGAGLTALAAADIVLLVQTATGSYDETGATQAGLLLGLTVIAAAAWQRERPHGRRGSGASGLLWLTGAPVVYGLGATTVLVYDHFERLGDAANVLAGVTLVAVVVRLVLSVSENRALFTRTRNEARSDPLTGLRNRRRLTWDLAAVVAEASPERPALFAIFDLDGFKHYNDTFGHAAGDALLQRLGENLRATLGERSRTYRLGGDEFCVLTRPGDPDPPSALALAVEALAEQGDAFVVTSSNGSVWIPAEADSPTEALRLADQRMYASKRRRPEAAAHQTRDALVNALEQRAPGLGAHLDNTMALALGVGERLELSPEDMDRLQETAELHDIGKLAVPDSVLQKGGPLTPAEQAMLDRHPLIGQRILASAPALAPVAAGVRAVREHWDGTGRPDGLTRGEIPFTARIVAACSAYDRLSDAGPEQALAKIRAGAGTRFDPVVVEALAATCGNGGTPRTAAGP